MVRPPVGASRLATRRRDRNELERGPVRAYPTDGSVGSGAWRSSVRLHSELGPRRLVRCAEPSRDLPVVNPQLRREVLREAPTPGLRDHLGRPDVHSRSGRDPVGERSVHEQGADPGALPAV